MGSDYITSREGRKTPTNLWGIIRWGEVLGSLPDRPKVAASMRKDGVSQMERVVGKEMGLLTVEEDGCMTGQFHIIASQTDIPLLLLLQYHTTYMVFVTLWEHCRDFADIADVTSGKYPIFRSTDPRPCY